jgi:Protein of unknown function (DUF4058)
MPSPFPGMNPYIERPAIWPDFHDAFILATRAVLQPLLKPKYAALTQDRLYVVEAERPIYPDVAIVRTPVVSPASAAVSVAEPDAPTVFELWREEIREPLIHIVEPAANNRVVTSIEVLSPSNKNAGDGRREYLLKREELWRGGVNLVEIDLLRGGDRTVRLSEEKMKEVKPHHYLVAVTRRWPSRQEVYEILLQKRLPKVAIPLSPDDKDVILDLQVVFTRCWDEGPYPELLHYDGAPPSPLAPDITAWCEERLRSAGYRPAKTG